jgi:hypothetical protein
MTDLPFTASEQLIMTTSPFSKMTLTLSEDSELKLISKNWQGKD